MASTGIYTKVILRCIIALLMLYVASYFAWMLLNSLKDFHVTFFTYVSVPPLVLFITLAVVSFKSAYKIYKQRNGQTVDALTSAAQPTFEPSNQPTAGLSPQDIPQPASQPKKNPAAKIIIIVCVVIIAIPVISVSAIFGGIAISCQNKTSDLDKKVEIQKQNLNAVSIIDGQKTVATGTREGDCLTGNLDYQTAEATFNNLNQPLVTLAADVQKSMIKQGYTYGPEGQRKSLYGASTATPAVVVDGADEYYVKDGFVIIVKYRYKVNFTTPCQKAACDDVKISNFDNELSQRVVSTVNVQSLKKSTFDPKYSSY